MNKQCELIFVFDVESMGLYGEAFAVGWVVDDYFEGEIDSGYISMPTDGLIAAYGERKWLEENIFPNLPAPTITEADIAEFKEANPKLKFQELSDYYSYVLRSQFWKILQKWLDKGALIWVDCGFPIETNFLNLCIADNIIRSDFTYIFYFINDLVTLMFLTGKNPNLSYERLESEKPVYHPTKDARQSARLIRQCLEELL